MKFLPLIFILSACAMTGKPDKRIYQPMTIHLKGGRTIETLEGSYTPTQDETWYSRQMIEILERELSRL